jgi:hypothetical protein
MAKDESSDTQWALWERFHLLLKTTNRTTDPHHRKRLARENKARQLGLSMVAKTGKKGQPWRTESMRLGDLMPLVLDDCLLSSNTSLADALLAVSSTLTPYDPKSVATIVLSKNDTQVELLISHVDKLNHVEIAREIAKHEVVESSGCRIQAIGRSTISMIWDIHELVVEQV